MLDWGGVGGNNRELEEAKLQEVFMVSSIVLQLILRRHNMVYLGTYKNVKERLNAIVEILPNAN